MASSMLTAEVSAATSKETDVDEALKTALHSCANDPDFAIICDFLQKFSKDLGLELPNFRLLLQWLTKTDEVSPQLREMQIKLLRKTRKTVHEKSWESALSKFCFGYSAQDAWEIERFGYKNSSAKVKLRILRELLECQFERNAKFRAKILTLSADSLRSQPIGRDRLGHAYWVTQDNDCNIRIYQEHLDEEIWQVVATNRDEFVNLINRLRASEVVLPCTDIGLIDEDTSSSSTSNIEINPTQKPSPLEEKDDSQEDEQKVPKLSIKIVHGKNTKEPVNNKDVGKGEEELAAEEDAQKMEKTNVLDKEGNESGEEEFEEIEEEYDESEEESEAEEEEEEDKKISKKDPKNDKTLTKTSVTAKVNDDKKVKPLLISQNKVLNNESSSTTTAKKRAIDQVDASSPPRNDQQTNAPKKSRPSLLDSKRAKSINKFEDNKEMGEEDLEEESNEEDGDIEEEIEEEDIDSVAAEEDENEEKQFEDDDDDEDEDEDEEVGEEVTDPVVHVKGEGSGKDCDAGNFLYCMGYDLDNEDENSLSEAIVEDVYYVWGEGSGKECLVGNKNQEGNDEHETNLPKSEIEVVKTPKMETKSECELKTNFPCLNQKTHKETVPNDDKDNNTKEKEKENEKLKSNSEQKLEENNEKDNGNGKQIDDKEEKNKINGENKSKEETLDKKPNNSSGIDTQIHSSEVNSSEVSQDNTGKELNKVEMKSDMNVANATSQLTHANKMSVLESLKKELRESKQKLLEKKTTVAATESSTINKLSTPAIYNRKRRLTDQLHNTPVRPSNSESEVDLNSENAEDLANDLDVEIEEDIGGKRFKMRPKQTNTELRKKIEAQKEAANDETTSSSGGEEELRRRKKILAKESSTKIAEDKSENQVKTNETLVENCDKLDMAGQQSVTIKKPTQISPTKVKPTLDEIIEKKLKKTPEKVNKESVANNGNAGGSIEMTTSAKTLFPSPNKSPITKPLKKNLLTQIRQEESDEDAVPRKRTNSEELNIQIPEHSTGKINSVDIKPITAKIDPERQQRTTPERQRKRRSSEENVQNESPEEPEAKKEVTALKDKENTAKRDKTADTIKEEDGATDVNTKDLDIKRESATPTSSRRSGRRSGIAPTYVDTTLQTKRNRGGAKNSLKKELNECDKVIKEEKEDNDEKKIKDTNITTNLKQDIKEKPVKEEKPSNEKTTTSKEIDKEDDKVKTKPAEQTPKSSNSKTKPSPTTKTTQKVTRKKRDVDATNIIDADSETPVRQSRRIAQQKIREEAERRKLEEIALRTMKQELKKKKKAEKQADPTVAPPTEPSSESEESDVETKKKVQKKKCPGKNGNWSSGSEEQEEPDEEDEEPPHYETDPGSPLFKSDHEFSPESDIEDESQVVPMKRARTVRKEDAGDDVTAAVEEEEACQKCNKSDHPEWILLCDNCDKGYHCSCLSPVLFYIPEGDWYCPPCQQEQLIQALENQLKEFDNLVEKKRKEEEEVKRLAEEEKARQEKEEETKNRKNRKEGKTNSKRHNDDDSSGHSKEENEEDESTTNSEDSSDGGSKKRSAKNKNYLNRSKNANKSDKRNHRDRRQNTTRNRRNRQKKHDSSDESENSDSENSSKSKSDSKSGSSSSSSTYSDSDNEPIYKLRKRRQINVSYRLNEYDDLINSALKKEMDEAAGAGNLGRGKDISTIIEADKEEKARQKQIEDGDGETEVKPKEELKDKENGEDTTVKKESILKSQELKAPNKDVKKDSIKPEVEENDSDAEPIMRKFNIKPSHKKKSRKLTTLDISSEDDDDASDEDFKGSSFDEDEEEDTSISASNSDSSLEIYKRHGKSKKKRRKAARRAFRERRKDRRFVVDESDDEEIQRPKSKKKRKDDSDYTESEADDDDISELSENIDSADLCDDTTTDESDGAWRPNKRKKAKKSNTSFTHKSPKTKTTNTKKPKKVEYSDDDVSETEEDEDDDDNDNIGSGKGMGKQPRSQPLKTMSSTTKTKGKGKEKPPPKTKKKKKSSEDEDSHSGSEDSTRRTRGRRYAYIEDFDDDSSDGGIKPGVQRPDTPPEEREKFIKRQEEIKRMLAEKNAEGAKLVATPRLTPIKTDADKDKRSPAKPGGDSLSTVPLSVIRQAKVLDIDYLQRRGENLDDLSNDVGDVDDDFDDADLPDDLPEDMDEDAIARMVEEEEEFGAAAARELPPPDEVLRTLPAAKPAVKVKDLEKQILPINLPSSYTAANPQVTPTPLTTTSASGLQEPVRKRLPMPTMHPPLLRHQFLMHESMTNTHHLMQRHGGPPPPTSHLLQNALSAPLSQPLDRNYPHTTPSVSHHSLINRMVHNMPLQQSSVPHSLSTTRPTQPALSVTSSSLIAKTTQAQHEQQTQDKSANLQPVTENKPRGRRKKITPLRDTLQKQQTAAAVTAAAATNSALASAVVQKKNETTAGGVGGSSLPPSVIKTASPTKLPMQTSVIQSMSHTTHPISNRPVGNMPPISGAYVRTDGPRFYELPTGSRIPQSPVQRHRGPPQLPPSLLPPHPANRPTYGPPPPLKGSSTGSPLSSASSANTPGSIRNPLHHVPPPYLGMPPNARHAPTHLNMYGPPIYGNPNFGPRVNLRPPPNIHAPEYTTGSRAYPPYGFYPPPPPLTTPPGQRSAPPPRAPTQMPPVPPTNLTQPPASVIVSASTAPKSDNAPPPPAMLSKSTPPAPATNADIIKTNTSSKTGSTTPELPNKISHPITSSTTSPVSTPTEKTVIATAAATTTPSTVIETEPRKKLTTLEAFSTSKAKKSPERPNTNDSTTLTQNSPVPSNEVNDDSSTPGATDNTPATEESNSRPEGQASEFSGLVSYFSSQHDDYNT
ncbi:uncharacterized protein ACRADG_004237 isoform 2-T2 [Cochliomyia hominivorax]